MSKIDDMIVRLCPDGVEYKPLGEVAKVCNGRDYKHLNVGTVPVYGSGGIITYVDEAAYEGPSVLLPRKGSIANVFYVDGPFWNVDTIYYTRVDQLLLSTRYFYHVMVNEHIELLNTSNAARPALTSIVLKKIRIPIPPLEIQKEIVRVLDSFTELEARRKQYEYYRDQLLTFPEGGWTTLGEAGTLTRGRRFTAADYVEDGIGSIHYGEIYTHYGVSTSHVISHLPESMRADLRFAQPGDVVIAATGENVKDLCKAVAWMGNDDIAVHDDCYIFHSMKANPKFISHVLLTSDAASQKALLITNSKVSRMPQKNLEKIRVPLPPLAEQQRIVDILDKFDALVNDLTSGLPAEIEARRKQYEYYRDKLLTFKEKVA